MATTRFLTYPVFQAFDDNGNPLSGGKVNVYSEGTTDRIDTWTDATQNTKNANPVILNSRGEADIWFDAPAKIVLTDSADVTVKTIDSVSPLNSQTLTGKYNLLENGSFELDGDGDGQPDSWDIVETDGSSTVEIDTSTVAHGSNSLKFVSGSGGGGTATTSEKFPVADGENLGISFFVASTATTATNKVDVIFYDSAGTNPSTSNVYTSSGTSPSSLTRKSTAVTVPANKTQAEVKLTGVDNAVTATTYFDFVQALDQGYIFTGTAGEVTADAAELNKIDGYTGTTAELNKLDGFTGSTSDLNALTSMGYWDFIESQTASSSSSLDFTTGIDSTHPEYLFIVRDIELSAGGALQARVSSDGGSNWDSGATDYQYEYLVIQVTNSDEGSTGASEIQMTVASANQFDGGRIILTRGASDKRPTFDWSITSKLEAERRVGMGQRSTNGAINAVRFLPSTGNIASGSIFLYGWVEGS